MTLKERGEHAYVPRGSQREGERVTSQELSKTFAEDAGGEVIQARPTTIGPVIFFCSGFFIIW